MVGLKIFNVHYQHEKLEHSKQHLNATFTRKHSTQSYIWMSSSMLQQRDLGMLVDGVCVLTPLREMDQSLYLSHESTAFHLYFQQTHGEVHQHILSTLTLAICVTDFSRKIGITTTISTKYHKMVKFPMLSETKVTPLLQSSFMSQYLFAGVFTYYIIQKQKGVAQHLLFGKKISG